MVGDTFSKIIWGAILFGIITLFYLARRRRRTQRLLIMELLKRYFEGDISADQLGRRTRVIANHHFLQSAEFHSLAIAGFQGAVDAKFANQSHEKEDERKLLSMLAALKNEFGLTDRYRVEGVRPGRE